MSPSRRRLVTVLGLVAVSLFCVALVGLRFAESGSTKFTGLIWNLFLAWIPFVLAVVVYDRWRRHGTHKHGVSSVRMLFDDECRNQSFFNLRERRRELFTFFDVPDAAR